ncbi:flagellar basal-body MS-ring/collar protein FliF [Chitinivorax sp. B]|uniref:flagellar basal-body MS-ring/collar protein FliF n=1 Tax=Chitinivorax sp. B TaxID=2502235 RepID=UPI00201701D8|nr:flagellar basal-body MS-ring/collar protein FliF [Chitinivorax sp. B]
MSTIQQFWQSLEQKGRVGLVIGLVAILAITAGIAYWAFRSDYRVLFSGLSPQDGAAMVAELDRMKVPYQLEQGGETILVAAETVHKTRLQLMGKDIPLHGSVGFELFNNNDFGMTEFAQKVNYQRALQGEITRTILAIEEIQAARVHLALPEQGLFKKNGSVPKASVTVTVKPGRQLEPEQVRGIQRLVSSSVNEIRPEDVTIIDQHGVALTKAKRPDSNENLSQDLVDQKKSLEDYLTRKLDSVLERTFGQGQAIASVDVMFTDKHVKQTTEDVLPAAGQTESRQGLIVRERQTRRSNKAADGDLASPMSDGADQRETEYQVGRRVEQTERAPGAVERISVAVVLRQTPGESQLERLQDVVSNAVGLNIDRGDTVAVYTASQLAVLPGHQVGQAEKSLLAQMPDTVEDRAPAPTKKSPLLSPWQWIAAGLLGGVVMLFILVKLFGQKRPADAQSNLTADEREAALKRIRSWMKDDGDQSSQGASL